MKKLISAMLAIVLVLSFALPAFAASDESIDATNDRPTRDELVAMGCELFPEYADLIVNPPANAAMARSAGGDAEIVAVETRDISEDETLTYIQYSTDVTNLLYQKSWKVTSTTNNGNTYKGNLTITCNLSTDVFSLAGFSYTMNLSGYDYIGSTGSVTASTCSFVNNKKTYFTKNFTETASLEAYLEYRVLFAPHEHLANNGVQPYSTIIRVVVANNKFTVKVNGTAI